MDREPLISRIPKSINPKGPPTGQAGFHPMDDPPVRSRFLTLMKKPLPTLSLACLVLASGCVSTPQQPALTSGDSLTGHLGHPGRRVHPAARFQILFASPNPARLRRSLCRFKYSPLPPRRTYRVYTGVSGLPAPTRQPAAPVSGYQARREQYTSNPIYAQRTQPAENRQISTQRPSVQTRPRTASLGARREVTPPSRLPLAVESSAYRSTIPRSPSGGSIGFRRQDANPPVNRSINLPGAATAPAAR